MTTRSNKKLKKEIEDLKRYRDFYSHVCCIIGEGSEFMTKTQMYEAIKKEMEITIRLNNVCNFETKGTK